MREQFGDFEVGESEVAHKVVSDNLRERILTGKIAPNTELPSTLKLAELWKTSKSTVHIALNNLVKEGLLDRFHGSATYVRKRGLKLQRVGIYYDSPEVWIDEERCYARSLQGCLEEKLKHLGIDVAVFVDRRPKEKQGPVLPELLRAVESREIQGLILPLINSYNLRHLLKLPVASSVQIFQKEPFHIQNKVCFAERSFFREILARLKKKGCRSVALISTLQAKPETRDTMPSSQIVENFLKQAKQFRMETRSEWTPVPIDEVLEKARFGYREFHKLWKQSNQPDAVIVFPDMAVRGVIAAALELGVAQADRVTFCFHKNARVDILCPFPAIWTIADEAKIADSMINMVRRQFAGKTVSPVHVPHTFQMDRRTV